MRDWFSWNGVKCTEKGMHVLNQPGESRPAERMTTEKIFGRSGSLTKLEGDGVFDDVIKTCDCLVKDPTKIPEISRWLSGRGRVTFATRTGGHYMGRVSNQIDFTKVLRGNPHRKFTVNFRCDPYWYYDNVADITVSGSGTSVTNPGTAEAVPKIKITGSGDITLMVTGGGTAQSVVLTGIDGGIILDGPNQEAYAIPAGGSATAASMNDKMDGEFLTLAPGANQIAWTGSVTSIVITPNWRDLG